MIMLKGQDGGWNKNGHLLIVGNRLKGSAHCNLRFTKSHIGYQQPVH